MSDIRIKDIARTETLPRAGLFAETDHAADGSGKIDIGIINALRNSLATKPRLACDGSAAANRPLVTLPASCALGTDPRGFFDDWSLPSAKPAALTLLWCWGASATAVSANCLAKYLDSTGAIVFRLYGDYTTDYRECRTSADVWTTYGALREILDQFGGDSAGRDYRINGLDVTLSADSAPNPNGTAPANWSGAITSTYLYFEGSIARNLAKFWPTNFRPTLTDAQDSFFLGGGVPFRFRFGGLKYTSDFSAGTDSWLFAGDTVTGNVDGISGENDWLSAQRASTTGLIQITHTGTAMFSPVSKLFTGMALRLKVRIYNGSATPRYVNYGFSGAVTAAAKVLVAATTKVDVSIDHPINAGDNGSGVTDQRLLLVDSGGSNPDTTVPVGDIFYYKNVKIYFLGALFLLSPSDSGDGLGFQLHDIGPNLADLTLSPAGWTWTQPTRRAYIRGLLTWAATNDVKSLLGQVVALDGFRVDAITLKSSSATSGSGATLGNSNSATRYAAATALTTAKKVFTGSDLANKGPGGTTSTYLDLTVTPDSAAFTGTIQVTAELVQTEGASA